MIFLFREENNIKNLQKYLPEQYLQMIIAKEKLYMGRQVDNIEQIFNENQLKEIYDEKLLQFCQYNQLQFNSDDQVSLFLEIKNCQSLVLKIYEINTLNFFKKYVDKTHIDSQINLDGLIASHEEQYQLNYSPVQKIVKQISLKNISDKTQGIFIVDIIGNGLQSRAIIQKGALIIVGEQTLAGHEFYILDQNLQICKLNSGIWLRDYFYKADDKGIVAIPFQEEPIKESVLVQSDTFVQKCQIELSQEIYQFECPVIFDQECVVMGQQGQILLHPRIFLNNVKYFKLNNIQLFIQYPSALDIAKNFKVVLTITNEHNIKQQLYYTDLKPSHLNEIEIRFQVPAKIKSIEISITAEIEKTNLTKQKLSHEQEIFQDKLMAKEFIYNQFLSKITHDSYQINLLGKNGEPLCGQNLKISISNRNLINDINISKFTNNNGELLLNNISCDVNHIKSYLSEDRYSYNQSWNLNLKQFQIQYPDSIQILISDSLEIPFLEEINTSTLSFLKILTNGNIESNQISKLQLKNYKLIFEKLEKGKYILQIKNVKSIVIEVIEGFRQGKFMVSTDKSSVRLDQTNQQFLYIQQKIIDDKSLKLNVGTSLSENARFHVILVNFFPYDCSILVNELKNSQQKVSKQVQSLQTQNNQYYSNKALSDEYNYVLERKQLHQFIGNSLEKPQGQLKQTKIRETHSKQEQLSQGTGYDDFCMMQQNAAFVSKDTKLIKKESEECKQFEQKYSQQAFNFLKKNSKIISNLRPDKHGFIEIDKKDLEDYQHAQLIGIDFDSVCYDIVKLQNLNLQTQNITHTSQLENDKFYSLFRNAQGVKQGDSYRIDDIQSSEYRIIDNIQKLFAVQDLINQDQYGEWEFFKEWHFMKQDSKLKKYDQFCSDEFNFFLFFKDQQFFDQVCKPFISNKLEKTFIDYFFLNDQKALSYYLTSDSLAQLNSFEKTLMVNYLVKINQLEQASFLVQRLLIEDSSEQDYNSLFDTVLGSNAVQEDEYSYDDQEGGGGGGGSNQECLFGGDFPRRMMKMSAQIQQERKQVKQGFKELEVTCEYAERHYYGKKNISDSKYLISNNLFWKDLAQHFLNNSNQPFLSANFVYCSSRTEMLAALSVLDLPFENSQHRFNQDQDKNQIMIDANSNFIIFEKKLKETQSQIKGNIMVSQRFFNYNDRYIYDENNNKIEKEIDEYLVNKIYGCQVIVTNCSSIPSQFQLMTEIPCGSIPVFTSDYNKMHQFKMKAFSTKTFEYYFYFPYQGEFQQYPACVSKNSQVMAVSQKQVFKVQKEKQILNMDTFNDVINNGSENDILQFLREKNLLNRNLFEFDKIYHLMKNKSFYQKCIEILKQRKIYDQTCWYFSVLHSDLSTFKELLSSQEVQDVLRKYLQHFESDICRVTNFRFLEYLPLTNTRAHQLHKDKSNILNKEFEEQYLQFLKYMIEVKSPQDHDYLYFTYYLLLQDKIDQSIQIFKKINLTNNFQLQYDYLNAYLDLYTGGPEYKISRQLAQKYKDYPIYNWRKKFLELQNLFIELDQTESPTQESQNNSNQEQIFNASIKQNQIEVSLQNVKSLQISYFQVDLEVLFSQNPFLDHQNQEFLGYVQANLIQNLSLNKQDQIQLVKIPEQLLNQNVIINVQSSNKTQILNYFSSNLNVLIDENYGIIRVRNSERKCQSNVYCKVFAQLNNGTVQFFKDGYTDVCGRFAYALTSSNTTSQVKKFSILVVSDSLGSLTQQASPPSKLNTYQE